jgi:glutaredoxin 3
MNIVIYTKRGCVNCTRAKHLLASKRLGYFELYQETDVREFAALLTQFPEARQMPQIFINNQRVGGLAGLQAALKELGL